jgi:hypothetical protein
MNVGSRNITVSPPRIPCVITVPKAKIPSFFIHNRDSIFQSQIERTSVRKPTKEAKSL